MPEILITGSKGQLGRSIEQLSSEFPSYHFYFTDVDELDITDQPAVQEFLSIHHIDFIINCAAYTAVDMAENETESAMMINAIAARQLAKLSANFHIPFIHISTDYVFDGKNFLPYKEDDHANPSSGYGKSKLAGETEIRKHAEKAVIIRTSWLYSEYGHNFVKTMLKYGKEKSELKVVCDQIGTPTYAGDLARTILEMLPKIKDQQQNTEIYHYGNEGAVSWYDFAIAIMELAAINCIVIPIETREYPLPAPRPYYSVLNKRKIKDAFQIVIPYWKDSLTKCLRNLQLDK